MELKAALCQFDMTWEDPEANLQRAGELVAGADADLSFHSQSTYVLPVPGKPGQFIYMGDRWTPDNAIDGRYIWLPIRFDGDQPVIEWRDKWSY